MAELGKRNEEFLRDMDIFHRDMDGSPSTGFWECPECGADWDGCAEECEECGCDRECAEEPSFSWNGCDCCGSMLGGDLHPVIGWLKGAQAGGYTEKYQWDGRACTDCVLFFANGDLPEP